MRKSLLFILILLSGVIFIARLLYLQVFNTDLKLRAELNAISKVYDFPQRGFIFDRNGKLLVSNQPSYDVMVIPNHIRNLDTLAFINLLNIEKDQFKTSLERAIRFSPRLPSVLLNQLTKEEYAHIQEKMYLYRGFYIQERTLRDYNVSIGANILGYISEVNQAIIDRDPYYRSGDMIGRTGVESQYEEVLRGAKGVKYIQKDRFNRDIGPFKDGMYDTLPTHGKDIKLTIDATLQEYGELLMQGKRGGIVAIEPASGEILALITAPSYDPSLLVGRQRSRNYTQLFRDSISKPLFDRALLAEYPPGSTFKMLTGLIALEEGVLPNNFRHRCGGGLSYGRGAFMRCRNHIEPVNIVSAMAVSCNSLFGIIYRDIIDKYNSPQEGIEAWKNHLNSFGLGNFLGNDLPTGRRGRIPDADYYNRIYNYPRYRWFGAATISNSIGQGEILTTPMQLANMTAAIANRGYYITPHVLKEIKDIPGKEERFTQKNNTTISPEHFDPIIEGMYEVYNSGSASFLKVPDIEICGKTGTAENFTRIDGRRVKLTSHSIFVAFAPKDNPKIALAVFVENGASGARYAGRIATLMIEKYLKNEISRKDLENWILNNSLEEEYARMLNR